MSFVFRFRFPTVLARGLTLALVLALAWLAMPGQAQDLGAPEGPAVPVESALPPPSPVTTAGQTVQVANPYGLGALLAQGDLVSKATLGVLAIMSAATWYILVVKLIEQQKLFGEAREADRNFWISPTVASGMDKLRHGGPFWYLAERGISADHHHEGTMVEQIDRSTWITMSVNRAVDTIQSKLTGGLAVLATVGSTAPFVGLFGTVWGIYHALTQIGISGQASIDKVAGPVGEALIMTAIGLAVAVPAVLGYNWLVRRNKNAMDRVRAFASDLHSVLLSGARVGDRK